MISAATLILAGPLHAQASRDSAGIRIVENARPAWSDRERLRLAEQPQLVIGNTTDSVYRFRGVRGVVRLTDGRVVVADGGSMQLRMYNSQGQFLSASGGRGREPGQLLNMGQMWRLRGDTIAINESFSVSLFSNNGEFVRKMELPLRPDTIGGRPANAPWLFLLAMTGNGAGIATPIKDVQMPAGRSVGTRWTQSVALKVVTPAGEIIRDVGTFPFLEFQQVASGPTTIWLGPGGVITGGDAHFYAGFGDRYAIHVYASDGSLKSIIRRAWKPEPITDSDWEHWVVEWSKLWVKTTGPDRERDIQKVRDEPWAEQDPAFSQFIVDRAGKLWVRGAHWQDAIAAGSLTDTPAVPSSWSVFDIQGRWLGDVEMPTGFKALEIGPDYVAGTKLTDGRVQVVIYALSPSGR